MIEVLADEAIRKAESINIDAIEVFIQKKNLKKVEIVDGGIKNIIEKERSGLAIRSIINNQLSFVSTNAINKVNDVVELSAQNAKESLQKISTSFVDRKIVTPVKDIRDDRLRDISLEDVSEGILDILSSIEESKPLKKLEGTVTFETEERLVANSEGLWKREVGTRMNAEIMTSIQVGDFIGVGSSQFTSRTMNENWQELFNSSIKTAYSQQNRKKMTIGRPRGIILSPQAAAKIITFALIPSFNHSSGSQHYDSLRNCRFNKNLQMVDDPTYPGAQNTFGFDDEGYPSKPRLVLSGGKCKRFLGMNFSCPVDNQKEYYRGNCYRVAYFNRDVRSYVNPPTVSSSNFVIKARKQASDDLVKELSNGIYVKEITGAQDASYFSGDFVVSVVEAYEINNGEIINPILPCYCSGNIYKILEDSSLALGNNLTEVTITATPLNVIMPDILTSRMTISI